MADKYGWDIVELMTRSWSNAEKYPVTKQKDQPPNTTSYKHDCRLLAFSSSEEIKLRQDNAGSGDIW
jgi:hypothetical protein